MCNIFVKGNNSSLKVHTEIKHKDKTKSGIYNKDKANSDTNSKNKQMPTLLCDLSLMGGVEFEGFRQDEVDQLEALLYSEVCEESDDGV